MGKRSPSVLQGAMLVLSLFATTAPWIVRPLLSSSNTSSAPENATIENNVTTSTLKINIVDDNLVQVTNDSRIQYAFLTIGFCILALGVVRLPEFVMQKRTPLQRPRKGLTISGSGDIPVTFYTKLKYVMLFLVFNILHITIEIIWGFFSAGYVAKYFVESTKDAAVVPFWYWCCMTGSRVPNTIISRWLSPGILSLLAPIGIVVTAIVLVIVGEDNQTAMLLCSGFTGFFVAPMVAAAISRLCFYQTRSAWSRDQGSNKNHSSAYNFAPTVTKFCVMWEGLSLPHDTKFGNCRCQTVDSRVFPIWSLIPGSSWSGLIKAEPG